MFEHVPSCHGAKAAQVSSVIGTVAQLPRVTGDTYLWLLVDIHDVTFKQEYKKDVRKNAKDSTLNVPL